MSILLIKFTYGKECGIKQAISKGWGDCMDLMNEPWFVKIFSLAVSFILITALLMTFIMSKNKPGYSLLGFKKAEDNFMIVPFWFRLLIAVLVCTIGALALIQGGVVSIVIGLGAIYIGIKTILPMK